MRIDAHQHFWALERGDYGWLTPDLAPLYRDFGPEDLRPALKSNRIDGTILVQAAPTVAETEYMLALAAKTPFVKGVVGWVDFESRDAPDQIAALAETPALVGLRPMIQDIPDTDWMLRPALRPAIAAMQAFGLVFDALTLPQHLTNLRKFIDTYPDLSVVVDHGSKPGIAHKAFDTWAADMTGLANETRAAVKLSGLVTEAAQHWTADDLRPYVDHLRAAFGPSRLLWGSDWPVCTLAASYGTWCATTDVLLEGLSVAERAQVMGLTAVDVYGLTKEATP